MISLLARYFIPDRENLTDPRVRERYGVLCGGVGIALNLLLFVGKFIAGLLSGSIAVTSDAFNNLSDSGSSLISMIGFKLAGRKPDPDHPFGHGRFEYVSGLIVSMLILLMGFELATTSIDKIRNPAPPVFNWLAVIILGVSILVKLYMMLYNRRIGKKIDSAAMRSTATDSLSDCISTAVVLACTLLSPLTSFNLDAWCGVAVSVFILIAGIRATIDTVNPLLGMPPEPEFVNEIEKLVMSHETVVGIHDLIVHNYGPGRCMITLHAEVPCDGDLLQMHEVIDDIESDLRRELGCEATIHMDPIATSDPKTLAYRETVLQIIKALDPIITMHDFRVVHGENHTNLIFDVVLPFDYPVSDDEMRAKISALVREQEPCCFCVINVDKSYVGVSHQK